MFILETREHIDKADYNFTVLNNHFIKYIDKSPCWICVIAFYSALHYVDAYLLKIHKIRNIHHDERNSDVGNLIQEISGDYNALYDYGKKARYDKIRNQPDEEDADYAVNNFLPRIREHILGYF